MTLDIRGSIKNTKLSSNRYVVFEELISNAIDSFLIRKNTEATVAPLSIMIDVKFTAADLLGEREAMSVACTDNGCGLGDEQLKAFLTKDTSYKDDLGISGIGKCKGAGRIQFFHHFAEMSIDSRYREGDQVNRRTMHFAEPRKQIDFEDFETIATTEAELGTTIWLDQLKDGVRERAFLNERLSEIFAAPTLRRVTLVAFLQRLVGLADELGDFEVRFRTRHWKQDEQVESLCRADLPKITREVSVKVEERDPRSGDPLGTHQVFSLSHYQLDAADYDLPRNAIAFCAKSSPVRDITAYYLRTKSEQRNPVGGFHHIVLIESEYLDGHVNEQRDNFDDIPDEVGTGGVFGDEKLSYATIHEAIDPVIEEMVAPADWKKEDVLREIAQQFGVGPGMLADTETRIRYGDGAQQVVERVLRKYQDRVISATAEIFDLKEDIIKTEPDTDEFRTKVNELSWKYTASLKDFDMANLSQLIVRRAAIVEILDLACRKKLAMQASPTSGKRKDERIIHSIFFPMRKDSTEFTDHDIWLLSEEYQYYDHIASDKPLAQIPWSPTEKVFDSDIDEEFRRLLSKRADDNAGKRPDIALFNKEGSAIIIEFKAPTVSLDDHTGDLVEYAHLLAAKSHGKLRKFYCYLIGDTINPLRLNNWIQFPDGKGFFQASPLIDPQTRAPLGELYSEMLYYDDVVGRAKKRIAVYQQKLKVDLRSGR